jgi:uncharacterized phage infection (PIP) family protein YhgE
MNHKSLSKRLRQKVEEMADKYITTTDASKQETENDVGEILQSLDQVKAAAKKIAARAMVGAVTGVTDYGTKWLQCMSGLYKETFTIAEAHAERVTRTAVDADESMTEKERLETVKKNVAKVNREIREAIGRLAKLGGRTNVPPNIKNVVRYLHRDKKPKKGANQGEIRSWKMDQKKAEIGDMFTEIASTIRQVESGAKANACLALELADKVKESKYQESPLADTFLEVQLALVELYNDNNSDALEEVRDFLKDRS